MCGNSGDCEDCSERCEPRFKLAEAVKCSEHLIWILMYQHGAKTQPLIANAIANYVGATSEQRDEIVDAKHRGTWQPSPKKVKKHNPDSTCKTEAKRVVAVDRMGRIMKRFISLQAASKYVGCAAPTIANRCNGMQLEKDEFMPYGITFRFEEQWDRMTDEERYQNILERRHALE